MSDLFEIVEDLSEIEKPQYSRKKRVHNAPQYVGYDEPIDLLDCKFCGSCVDPNTCVWGVVCPECGSEESQLCRELGSGKLTGLHEARWELAKGRELAWR